MLTEKKNFQLPDLKPYQGSRRCIVARDLWSKKFIELILFCNLETIMQEREVNNIIHMTYDRYDSSFPDNGATPGCVQEYS